MSSGIILPSPEIIASVEQGGFEEYFEEFQSDCRHIEDKLPQTENSVGIPEKFYVDLFARIVNPEDPALTKAREVLKPVEKAVLELPQSHGEFSYSTLLFERLISKPRQPFMSSAVRWHSDGDFEDTISVRVDSRAASEILQGEVPEEIIEEMIEDNKEVSVEKESFDFEAFGNHLESHYGGYSDERLAKLGLYWVQPVNASAYVLRGHHIHRSPINYTNGPIIRDSFVAIYSLPSANSCILI